MRRGETISSTLVSNLYLLIGFIGLIMVLVMVNALIGIPLSDYGIVPRSPERLYGVLLAPFLHGNYLHALSNAVGLMALGSLAAIYGGRSFPWACLIIVVTSGLGVWLFGRPSTHIGASGLVFGLFGYLLVKGILDKSILSALTALVVAAVFGLPIVYGILPANDYISWEGHLCGLAAGVLAAIITRQRKSSSVPQGTIADWHRKRRLRRKMRQLRLR